MSIGDVIRQKTALLVAMEQDLSQLMMAILADLQQVVGEVADVAALADLVAYITADEDDDPVQHNGLIEERLAEYQQGWGLTSFAFAGYEADSEDTSVVSFSSKQLDQLLADRLGDVPNLTLLTTIFFHRDHGVLAGDSQITPLSLCDLDQLQMVKEVWEEWLATVMTWMDVQSAPAAA